MDTAVAQPGDVVDDGRMLPHLGMHGGAEHHRRPGGQQGGGEEVRGDPCRVAADQAGGGRGDHDQVGALTEAGVRDGLGPVPQGTRTGSEANADSVTGPTNRVAPRVMTGLTNAPASIRRRHTSTAL